MSTEEISTRVANLSPAKRAALAQLLGHDPQGPALDSPVAIALQGIWRDVLRTAEIGLHDSFFALGGDSITALQVAARLSAAGFRVTPRQVLEEETIFRLAQVAVASMAMNQEADVATGDVSLTPIQRWFFAQNFPDSHHWDQAIFVELHQQVDAEVVYEALQAVVAHHDVLCSSFTLHDGRWRQEVRTGSVPVAYQVADLAGMPESLQDKQIRSIVTEAQQSIDLAHGPLMSAVLFRLGDRPDRLLIAIHHLVVDGVSVRIIMEDLETAYGSILDGKQVVLPPRTASYRAWGHALAGYAASDEVTRQRGYWLSVPQAQAVNPRWSIDPQTTVNTVGRSATYTAEIPLQISLAMTRDAVRLPGVQPLHLFLAALALAWRAQTARDSIQIDLEGHGREPVHTAMDISRTVGWFTSIFPLVLEASDSVSAQQLIETVRHHLDQVPGKGMAYGVLRYLTDHGTELASLPASAVSFNFLGWFDRPHGTHSVFGLPLQVPSPLQNEAAPRPYLIEIVISGIGKRLIAEITYARDCYREEEIAAFAASFLNALRELVADCVSRAADQMSSIVNQIVIQR